MRAIIAPEPGGPDALMLVQRPVPKPGPHEVLIRLEAMGVNRPDCFQRAGHYSPPPGASDILGLEGAGTIVACGSGVGRWHVGDGVMALVTGGAYADYMVAHEDLCLAVPPALTMIAAGALPETLFTVWANVFETAHLQAGETCLVHGGASGIGTLAIQLAHTRGAIVFATAGSDEKTALCESLGARRAINYRTEDFVDVLRAETGGRGVDVILDMVGGSYINRNFACAARRARIVQIAFLQGSRAEVDFMPLMTKRLVLTGSTLRPRPVHEKADLARVIATEVMPLIAAGTVRPPISATFALSEAAQAHRLMESGSSYGKIVLVP